MLKDWRIPQLLGFSGQRDDPLDDALSERVLIAQRAEFA